MADSYDIGTYDMPCLLCGAKVPCRTRVEAPTLASPTVFVALMILDSTPLNDHMIVAHNTEVPVG